MKDYVVTILYHPGKANIVTDALSYKLVESLSIKIMRQMLLLEEMKCIELEVVSLGVSTKLTSMVLQPTQLETE